MNFILLFALIGIVIIGVVRALKHRRPEQRRLQREPFLSNEPIEAVAAQPQPAASTYSFAAEDTSQHAEYSVEQPTAEETEEAAPDFDPPQAQTASEKPPLQISDLIIINLNAEPKQPYRGYELLQALLTAGLRYSRKGLFHRYDDPTGRGAILFNLVSAVEPGTFDIPKMGSFSTQGLTLFMQIPTVQNPRQVFELMLSTAKELVEDLGGQLLDDKRQPLSEEKIAKWRTGL